MLKKPAGGIALALAAALRYIKEGDLWFQPGFFSLFRPMEMQQEYGSG
jgi:hypothetical protein